MKIWCLLRDQLAHVKPVEAVFGRDAEFVYDADWEPAALLEGCPDLVLAVNDYPFDISRCRDAAREHGIPSLILQDGILEWRCQYENPLFGAGGGAPQHQPVMADKIACIGHSSARRIAGWGNENKVEVTGMPRLDELCSTSVLPPKVPGSRILVMTAKNPGFTPAQREITTRSIQDVKEFLGKHSEIQTTWRVSKSIADSLGLSNQLKEIGTRELKTAVTQVDAVITTPTTAMIESMLLDRPVAVLDYHNVPDFVPAAWKITAKEHIGTVVNELLSPSAAKIAYQRESLADTLLCDGCASVRVRRLIELMVESAKRGALSERSLEADLLGQQHSYKFFPPPRIRDFYPEQEVFSNSEADNLKVRLARATHENRRLKEEVRALKSGSSFQSWVRRGLQLAGRFRKKSFSKSN